MSVRTDLATALATALGDDYRVVGWQHGIDRVPKRTVMVWVDALTPVGISSDNLKVDLALWVLTPSEDTPTADDDLDDALLDVIEALRPLTAFTWTRAQRGVYEDRFHGYQLTISAAGRVTPEETP